MNTMTTRLDEIAERNSRGRKIDLAFAMMIAVLLFVCVAGLRAAAAPSMTRHATPDVERYAAGACDVETDALC